MDEMADGLKKKKAEEKPKRRSNYPEAIQIMLLTDMGEVDTQRLLYHIVQHHPGIVVKAFHAVTK